VPLSSAASGKADGKTGDTFGGESRGCVALDREARAIHAELTRTGYRERFDFVTRWAAEALDLLRELRELKPTIAHFSGHCARPAGTPDREQGRDVVAVAAPSGDEPCGPVFDSASGCGQVVKPEAFADAGRCGCVGQARRTQRVLHVVDRRGARSPQAAAHPRPPAPRAAARAVQVEADLQAREEPLLPQPAVTRGSRASLRAVVVSDRLDHNLDVIRADVLVLPLGVVAHLGHGERLRSLGAGRVEMITLLGNDRMKRG